MTATGSHAPFRAWIVVLFHILQMLFLLFNIGIVVAATVVISRDYIGSSIPALSITTIVVLFVLLGICLLCTMVEMVQFCRHALSPVFYLISNLVKAAIFIASFIMSVIAGTTVLAIVVNVALLLLFILPVIYGSIVVHKSRRVHKADSTAYKGHAGAYPATNASDLEAGTTRQYNHQKDPRFESYRQSIVEAR